MLPVSDCLVVGILHFFGQFRGQLEVLALVKIHRVRNYFPKKSYSTIKLFFFFKYVLYQTVLSKYLKKIGCHRACFLINCRERWIWFCYVCVYSSDPSPQLESRRAAPQASQPPSKASARTFNSTTRRPRSGNPQQTSG